MIRYIVRKRFYFLAALFDSLMIPPTNSFEMRFEMFSFASNSPDELKTHPHPLRHVPDKCSSTSTKISSRLKKEENKTLRLPCRYGKRSSYINVIWACVFASYFNNNPTHPLVVYISTASYIIAHP
jgi:hypothetical protein